MKQARLKKVKTLKNQYHALLLLRNSKKEKLVQHQKQDIVSQHCNELLSSGMYEILNNVILFADDHLDALNEGPFKVAFLIVSLS